MNKPVDNDFTTTIVKVKVPLRLRIFQRRLRARSTRQLIWISLKTSPRHPIATYKMFRAKSREHSLSIQRSFFFGDE